MARRLLVALDGSHRDEVTLAGLAEVCGPGGEITLLSVERPSGRRQIGTRRAPAVTHFAETTARLGPSREAPIFETPEQVHERQLVTMSTYLGSKADALQRQGYRVQIQPIVAKQPGTAIVEYARGSRPDAIVMARPGPGPLPLLFGSLASKVAQAGVAPVVLLPARKQ